MVPQRHPTPRRTWLLAALVALGFHLAAALLARHYPFPAIVSAEPVEPPPIEVVFSRPREEPVRFTELPEDRADIVPEEADFLSNADSRARDRARGDDDVPRLDEREDDPRVAMESSLRTVDPSRTQTEPRDAVEEERGEEARADPEPGVARASPPDGHPVRGRDLVLRSGEPRTPPAATRPSPTDLAQEARGPAADGALLEGNISLSTVAWDYAPWLIAFRREVIDHWNPPSAYFMGLIHGWAEIELDVGRDGRVRHVKVLDDDVGHRSLTSAAMLALDGAAPYRPLPRDFPDESLVIRIRFAYPRLKR